MTRSRLHQRHVQPTHSCLILHYAEFLCTLPDEFAHCPGSKPKIAGRAKVPVVILNRRIRYFGS